MNNKNLGEVILKVFFKDLFYFKESEFRNYGWCIINVILSKKEVKEF